MPHLTASEETSLGSSKFERIYLKYNKPVYYCALNILKDPGLAEDAVQEAFLRLSKNLHKIEETDCNKTLNFLVTIVRNVSFTMLKKRKSETVISTEIIGIDFEDENSDVENLVVQADSMNYLLEQIKDLKEELRQPLLLRCCNGLSEKEIASVLNISTANVAVRIHRAKKKLSKILLDKGGLDDVR